MRFKVKNFTGDQVAKIEQEWDDIKTCILSVPPHPVVRPQRCRPESQRAAIPIAYYLFHKGRDKTNGSKGCMRTSTTELVTRKNGANPPVGCTCLCSREYSAAKVTLC